jgi:cob(I)alamin adenosyltransferase
LRQTFYNPTMSKFYSGTGDDGTTGLLGGERVSKDHPQPQAYGVLDEASAALGLARAVAGSDRTREIIIEIQRDLYHMMAEVAAVPQVAEKFRRIDSTRVAWIESQIDLLDKELDSPKGFILGGDTLSGAVLDLARTIVRRSERCMIQFKEQINRSNPELVRYLNRLSSLCFVLILWENHHGGVPEPTLAKIEDL